MRVLALLLVAISVSGCSSSLNTWGTQVPMGENKYAPVPSARVIILLEKPTKEYEQIGIVSAIGGAFATDGDMYKKMQKEAAAMGADAIIVQPQKEVSTGLYPKTNAIAIKYKNLAENASK